MQSGDGWLKAAPVGTEAQSEVTAAHQPCSPSSRSPRQPRRMLIRCRLRWRAHPRRSARPDRGRTAGKPSRICVKGRYAGLKTRVLTCDHKDGQSWPWPRNLQREQRERTRSATPRQLGWVLAGWEKDPETQL